MNKAVALFLFLLAACSGTKPYSGHDVKVADLIISGGVLVSMDENAKGTAVAVAGQRILAVGTQAELAKLKGPNTETINLPGALIIPGLIDSHMHFARLGKRHRELFLDDAGSAKAVADIVSKAAKNTPPDHWIIGKGWHTSNWKDQTYPHRSLLDTAAPKNPVYLAGMSNHAAWANTKALEIARVTKGVPVPAGGQLVSDKRGLTGVLLEDAKDLVRRHLPKEDEERILADLRQSNKTALEFGLTQVHEAGVDDTTVKRYQKLLREGDLDVRLYVMRGVDNDRESLTQAMKHDPIVDPSQRLNVRSLKIYSDGALGARGAALLEPYHDRKGESGGVVNDAAALTNIFMQATENGFQVAIHAIGDRGNRNVLDAIKAAERKTGKDMKRPRIEHAQVLALNDIARFKREDVIASMQPIHATMDMSFAEDRLGERRLKGAYAWNSLIESGVVVSAGSDTPAYPIPYTNPLWGYHAAITRSDRNGNPEGGWTSAERVDRLSALRMYTLDAAYAGFAEKDTGSLSVGKLADITVLSRDITKITPREILSTKVLMTVVGGQIKYHAKNTPNGGH